MDTTTDGKFRFLGMAVLAVTLAAVGGYRSAHAQPWSGWPAQQAGAQPRADSWGPSGQRGWAASDGGGSRPSSHRTATGAWSGSGWQAAPANGSGAVDGHGVETGTEDQYGQRTWANLGKPDRAGGGRRKPQASYWHHDPGIPPGYGVQMAPPPAWGGGYFGVAPPYYGSYGRGGYGDWPFNWGGMPGFNPFGFW